MLLLDGSDVRHLRRPGGLLMLRVRVRGPNGIQSVGLAPYNGVIVTESGGYVELVTPIG